MSEHYSKGTESDTRWCTTCHRFTQHSVSGNRLGRCMEHDAPTYSKKQIRDRQERERQEKQGDLFAKRPQPQKGN